MRPLLGAFLDLEDVSSAARKWHQRTGRRLFGQTRDKKPLRLVGNETVAGDLAYLTYQPVSEA